MSEKTKKPLLFERWPALEGKVPWTGLAPLNTPVQRLETLEGDLGLGGLWVKRDDLTSGIYGGNKVRKLEFILAHVLEKGCRTVIGIGGIGSNHCVANAAFCRELGLNPVAALVNQPLTGKVRRNLLLNLHFGNEIVYGRSIARLLPKLLVRWLRDRSAYLMVPGGSNPLGTLGHVNALLELVEQVDRGELPEPDHIFVACGSAGTAAGLALGVGLTGLKSRVHAVQVSMPFFAGSGALRRTVRGAWKLMARHIRYLPNVEMDHLVLEPGYYGGVYGAVTPEALEAVALMKEHGGVELETTYTGKAFAALNGIARAKRQEMVGSNVLFWHTYNGRDFSGEVDGLDYRELPEALHWVFEKPLPPVPF